MTDFVKRIDEVLLEKNLKRAALCNDLDLSATAITDWARRGTVPAGDICLRIADYLGVSVEWLISGKESGLSQTERQLLSMFNSLSKSHQEELLEIGEQWAAKDKAIEKNASNA